MSERIVTDARGQRWDVREEGDVLVFRHQSGQEIRGEGKAELDALSTEDLLEALDEARREEGLPDVGSGGFDISLDVDGYETGRP